MDWTKEEIILIVGDYFEMLRDELNGVAYNKSAHRKRLAPLLHNRDKAIEYKHRNISGVLADMGLPYIKGYKPLFNYQRTILVEEVVYVLERKQKVYEHAFEQFAEEQILPPKKKINFARLVEKSPARSNHTEQTPSFQPIKINYLAREQHNRALGAQGEQLVLDYEKWRLTHAGKERLAEQVEWVSQEKGDGMGFDILSKNNNGTDRFIEVKTTKLAKETPIYFSRNEWKFALLKGKDFFLYRVFNFKDQPQLFINNGDYESFCKMEAEGFRGYF